MRRDDNAEVAGGREEAEECVMVAERAVRLASVPLAYLADGCFEFLEALTPDTRAALEDGVAPAWEEDISWAIREQFDGRESTYIICRVLLQLRVGIEAGAKGCGSFERVLRSAHVE